MGRDQRLTGRDGIPSGDRFRSYMITATTDEARLLAQAERALSRGVALIQIRAPSATPRVVERLVTSVLSELPAARERVLVNDRLDVALGAGAGGVHLKGSSLDTAAARAQSPTGFLIGRSVHDVSGAVEASRGGADFVVFGPIYPTASKPGHPGSGLGKLRAVVASTRLAVLAIGGVTAARVPELSRAGAAGVAGISVFESESESEALLDAVEVAPWRS